MTSLTIAAICLAAYLLVSVAVICALVPRKLLFPKHLLKVKQLGEIVSSRNNSIETGLKVSAALGAVGMFIFGMVQFIAEQNLKSEQLSADMLSKAIAQLDGKDGKGELHPMAAAGSIISLGLTAKGVANRNYHVAIFDTIEGFIRANQDACKPGEYLKPSYPTRADMQAAFRVFAERDVSKDTPGRVFNLEGSCLVGVDLWTDFSNWGNLKGLSNVRLAGSKVLRADLSRAELIGTDFRGIDAGDWLNEGWFDQVERTGINLHDMQDGENKYKYLRRKYITHFIDATLKRANFEGAGLEGADFSGADLTGAILKGANISRANFRGATITPEQLIAACVGKKSEPANQKAAQPVLSADVDDKLLKISPDGIPTCL